MKNFARAITPTAENGWDIFVNNDEFVFLLEEDRTLRVFQETMTTTGKERQAKAYLEEYIKCERKQYAAIGSQMRTLKKRIKQLEKEQETA